MEKESSGVAKRRIDKVVLRGNERKMREQESSEVAKRRSDKMVLLWRQTKNNINRSYGYVKIDVCPWDKKHVIYAFSSGHRQFS